MRSIVQAVLVVVILAAAIALAGWLLRSKPPPPRVTAPRLPPLVETLRVRNQEVRAEIVARGVLQPRERPLLTAQIAGIVAWISPQLQVGNTVAAGEELVRLDASDRELAVQRLRAELAEAEARCRVDDTVINRARLATVQAQLAQAELDLARTRLRAPAGGTISERSVELGQQVAPGTLLARLAAPQLELAVDFDEADIALLPPLPAPATVALDGEERSATLERLAPERDPRLRRVRGFLAIAGASDARWRPGAFATAQLRGRPLPPACAVPDHALTPEQRVWTVVDGRLTARPVSVVRRSAGQSWVGGLADGELLMVTRLEVATEGMTVRIASQP
ncbi:MAG: HlyD family efflux transporter periplasmic adaptor subunit [Planctomycetota bacterium]|nr:HlyD family efflux transporter periplasmic adaptor subunit [Planctomycetota bacterium]MCX8039933.1 HlyD family efflux transporter periplasmic adaptor subunit [Planctomycetota bacterium]MDW8373694.1 HlyD family efflux transporter periplasmic adaptor subunit [Planctomycetota bacterium]